MADIHWTVRLWYGTKMALKPVKNLILPSQAILALRPLYSSQNKGLKHFIIRHSLFQLSL